MMCGDYQQHSARLFCPEASVIMSHRNVSNHPPYTGYNNRENYKMNLEQKLNLKG